MDSCSHLDMVEVIDPPDDVGGCEECLAQGTGHPVIRSAEPGEDWSWCYVDVLMFRLRAS